MERNLTVALLRNARCAAVQLSGAVGGGAEEETEEDSERGGGA